MTTNNPHDVPEGGEGEAGFESGASFKVVSPPEGGIAPVTREEIEQQTAEMAAREDTPSHINYGAALDNAPGHEDSGTSSNDEAGAAEDANSENGPHEDDGPHEDADQHEDHSLSEQTEDDDAGNHSRGAGAVVDEVEGEHNLGADGGDEHDSSDHSLGVRTGAERELEDQSHEDHSGQDHSDEDHGLGSHDLDDDRQDDSLSGAHTAEEQGPGDHSLSGHPVEDDQVDHSLGGHEAPERNRDDSEKHTAVAQPRSESSQPLYRESESASETPTGDSNTAVAPAASAPPVTPVPPPAPDRAQQRADRDHALGKREKQEGAEEQAPVKPKPTTDKFFGSLGLFLLRLALAAVIGIYGIQKVRGVEGVQAMLTSTALRDIVPENFMLLLAWALAIGELAIAAGLLFGFLTRIAGFGALLVGAGALVLVHWLTNPISLEPGAGFPGSLELLIATVGLLFLFLGAGRWSIDGAIRSRRAAKKAAQH